MKKLFQPFHEISDMQAYIILFCQIIFVCLLLQVYHSEIIPSPLVILDKFVLILQSGDLYDNLFKSFCLITYGMGVAIVISLFFSYLAQLKFFTKLINIICSFRYLTLTGLCTIFTILSANTDNLRTNLLLFAIIPFFTVSMLDIINRTSKQDIELCYTLKKSRWWILWEVIVIGKLDQVFVVIGTNFAICWLMLTYVESKAFNLGGLGTMIIVADKYVRLEETIPLLLIILIIGILADYLLNFIRLKLFKYSNLTTI